MSYAKGIGCGMSVTGGQRKAWCFTINSLNEVRYLKPKAEGHKNPKSTTAIATTTKKTTRVQIVKIQSSKFGLIGK